MVVLPNDSPNDDGSITTVVRADIKSYVCCAASQSKMAVVASLGAAPFVLALIPLLVSFLQGVVPSIVVALIILVVMSTAMTWVTMPLLTRLSSRWLYPTT